MSESAALPRTHLENTQILPIAGPYIPLALAPGYSQCLLAIWTEDLTDYDLCLSLLISNSTFVFAQCRLSGSTKYSNKNR